MRLWGAAVLLVLRWYGTGLAGDCSAPRIAERETELDQVRAEIVRIEGAISGREEELREISREMESIRSTGLFNPLKRRRLESLYRESRSIAQALEPLSARRRTLEAQHRAVVSSLQRCFSDSLSITVRVLASCLQAKRFDQARTQWALVQELETKLERLGTGERLSGDYPTIADNVMARSLENPADRAFLLDTIHDLVEEARRDSLSAEWKLSGVRESLTLKEDLLRLVSEAGTGGLDGVSFFEEFGSEDVAREIDELRKEEQRLLHVLSQVMGALTYYRERIERLTAPQPFQEDRDDGHHEGR